MKVEVTPELLVAIKDGVEELIRAAEHLEGLDLFHEENQISQIIREAAEKHHQQYDMIKGWLKRNEKEKK